MKINRLLLTLIFTLTTVTAFAKEELHFYQDIYVNQQGKLVGKGLYQKYLGNYLYSLGNQNLLKAKVRDEFIIEYQAYKTNYYVVYNDNGTVRELGEKRGSGPDYSYVYRYNKKNYVQEIDYFQVKEDRVSFRYFLQHKTAFTYGKKNQLLKKEIFDSEKKKIAEIIYTYNKANNLTQIVQLSQDKITDTIKQEFQGQLVTKKLFFDKSKKLTKQELFEYDNNGDLTEVKRKTFQVNYFKTALKKVKLRLNVPEGILNNSLEYSQENKIIGVKGIIPNHQSYVTYNFKFKPSEKNKGEILAVFKNFSIVDGTPLNIVKSTLNYTGHEIKTEWYNQAGEELFSKIPKEIRSTIEFNILNMLNTKYLIYGEVLTQEKFKVTNEIIVEIYDQAGNRNWCFFSNGYFFYPVKFSDKVQNFKKIQILKAGYEYETLQFQVNLKKTVQNLSTTYLKIVYGIK